MTQIIASTGWKLKSSVSLTKQPKWKNWIGITIKGQNVISKTSEDFKQQGSILDWWES